MFINAIHIIVVIEIVEEDAEFGTCEGVVRHLLVVVPEVEFGHAEGAMQHGAVVDNEPQLAVQFVETLFDLLEGDQLALVNVKFSEHFGTFPLLLRLVRSHFVKHGHGGGVDVKCFD